MTTQVWHTDMKYLRFISMELQLSVSNIKPYLLYSALHLLHDILVAQFIHSAGRAFKNSTFCKQSANNPIKQSVALYTYKNYGCVTSKPVNNDAKWWLVSRNLNLLLTSECLVMNEWYSNKNVMFRANFSDRGRQKLFIPTKPRDKTVASSQLIKLMFVPWVALKCLPVNILRFPAESFLKQD